MEKGKMRYRKEDTEKMRRKEKIGKKRDKRERKFEGK